MLRWLIKNLLGSSSSSPQQNRVTNKIDIDQEIQQMKKEEISFNKAMTQWNKIRNEIDKGKKEQAPERVEEYVEKGVQLAIKRPDLGIVVGLLEKDAGLAYERVKKFEKALEFYQRSLDSLKKSDVSLEDSERIVQNKIDRLLKKVN